MNDEQLFERAADAVVDGDLAVLAAMLRDAPELVRARSARAHGVTLLHYVGANLVDDVRQRSPPNAVAVATLLLDAGAAVDAVSSDVSGRGTTLGEVATSEHTFKGGVQIDLLTLLVDRGASPDGAPGSWNPLLAALHNDRPEAAAYLASRGARLDLEGAAGVGRLEVVQEFVSWSGALLNGATAAQRNDGFKWAAEYGHAEVVRYLLDRGVDLRAGERATETALHLAAHRGQLATMRLLIDHGAPLEALNVYGGTALGQAIWSCFNSGYAIDYLPAIEMLLAAGARADVAGYPTGRPAVDDLLRRYGAA